MNSVEIAKKLIGEDNDLIQNCRDYISEINSRIEELEDKIDEQKKVLENLQNSLDYEKKYLQEANDERKEYLIDRLALQQFIANGGGLDMLDED